MSETRPYRIARRKLTGTRLILVGAILPGCLRPETVDYRADRLVAVAAPLEEPAQPLLERPLVEGAQADGLALGRPVGAILVVLLRQRLGDDVLAQPLLAQLLL